MQDILLFMDFSLYPFYGNRNDLVNAQMSCANLESRSQLSLFYFSLSVTVVSSTWLELNCILYCHCTMGSDQTFPPTFTVESFLFDLSSSIFKCMDSMIRRTTESIFDVTDTALSNFKPSNCSFYLFSFPESSF